MAACPHGVSCPPLSGPWCPHGTGSHLARGRLHPTRAGHPERCTRGCPQLPPPRILPAGGGQGGTLRLAAAMHPSSATACPLPGREVPGTRLHLTCQSPSGQTVTWPRCQASPSMVLMPITFLRTPLCSTKTPRKPAQGTHHGAGIQGRAMRGCPPHPEAPPWASGRIAVLTWGPGAQLVPEGQALGRRRGLVGLGGEGSCVPRRQGVPARAHHHIMAWGREAPVP